MTKSTHGRAADPGERLRGLSPAAIAALQEAALRLRRGDLDGAERVLGAALASAPSHLETLRLHGLLEQRRGRRKQAEAIYRRALERQPDDVSILVQLAEIRFDLGDAGEAQVLLRRAQSLAPAEADTLFRLGRQFDRHGLHAQALDCGHRALALAPAHALARLLVARSLQAQGRIDETAAEYRRLIADGGPRAYQAWFSLVDLKTVRLDADEVAALERAAADPALGDEALSTLAFALGRVYEDAARYDEALSRFTRANALVRSAQPWSASGFAREIDAILLAFDAVLPQAPEALGGEVVFVLGMPRSGTTLVEQILAAHPHVEGASELPDLSLVLAQESRRRGQPFPRWVSQMTSADWERLGRDYLARTARWRSRRPRSTDKLPDNWPLVGAIRAMLPAAKIVDCRRDALETCWSCYKQRFAPGRVKYAYDFADLGAAWRIYERLSRFWAEAHPGHVRVQHHEALLAAPEAEIRDLLAFCGLPFDPACLDFHTVRRDVRSASAAQVQQPLRRDTARARCYGERLAPLRAAIAGA